MIQERDAQLIVQCCVVLLCYPLLLSSLFIWLAITIHHVVVAVEGINVISVISISVCICCCWRWFIIVIIIGTVIKIIVVVAKKKVSIPAVPHDATLQPSSNSKELGFILTIPRQITAFCPAKEIWFDTRIQHLPSLLQKSIQALPLLHVSHHVQWWQHMSALSVTFSAVVDLDPTWIPQIDVVFERFYFVRSVCVLSQYENSRSVRREPVEQEIYLSLRLPSPSEEASIYLGDGHT